MEYSLDDLNRLSEVKEPKHIKSLSHALFPGTHCPLFGAAMIACDIEGLETIIIGTDECTYYTQAFAIDRTNKYNHFWSYAMEHGDIVFGAYDNIVKAVKEVYETAKPKAIMLVSTCVPEITGEDFEAVAAQVQEEIGIPIMVVHTDHFKCNSHILGIENTLTVMVEVMKSQIVKEKTINILGHRFGGIVETELYQLLKKYGYTISLGLPSKSSIEQIEKAPNAAVNIVTDFTAIPLAKKMNELFDTPYVIFDKFLEPNRIMESYESIKEVLQIPIDEDAKVLYQSLLKRIEETKEKLKGKTFIYGNSPMNAFELSAFLTSIGMKPLIIQARDLYENDTIYIEEILQMGEDPYVSSIANIAPLKTLYPILKPNFYLGHENPHALIKEGILQATFDRTASKLGYELPIQVLDTLLHTLDTKENPMLKMMGMSKGEA